MSQYTIYHNPRCSKSRQTLQLLREHGIEPEIRLYMEQPLSGAELDRLLQLLQKQPSELARKGEASFRERGLHADTNDQAQIRQAMLEEPRLIERPILVRGNHAVLGRPPEAILELINHG